MSLNPIDSLSEGVSKGIDNFAIGLGDDMLNMSSSMSSTNGTYNGKLLVDIATFTYNPLKDPAVINALTESALLYVVFLIAFIFIGGAYVQISRARPTRQMLGMNIKNGLSLKEYMVSVFALIILAPLIPFFMWCILLLSYIVSNLIMSGILPSILFTPDNVVLYVAMAFIYLLMSGAFVYRALIIGLCVGYCLVIIILIAIPYTRKLGKGLFTYYVLMVFMQPVILAVTCLGVGVVKTIAPFDPNAQMFGFMILSLLLFIIALCFILGPFTIMKLLGSAKNKIKLVL